ncbi:MAG: hypothetical protein E6Q92_08700 [Burkholderiaceae bacterium]|nr:MAG: hypothetical protein E6Q92_08700 [Burkholderiaceae bacterium]
MTPSMSPIVRRPSLFWPLTLLTLVAGLALCLYGSSLWLDLADPQLVFNGNGPDVHFSVQGWGDWAGGLAAALLAASVLIGLMLLLLVGLPLLLVGVAILVVASAALALLVPLLGMGAFLALPALLLILPIWVLIQRDRRRAA